MFANFSVLSRRWTLYTFPLLSLLLTVETDKTRNTDTVSHTFCSTFSMAIKLTGSCYYSAGSTQWNSQRAVKGLRQIQDQQPRGLQHISGHLRWFHRNLRVPDHVTWRNIRGAHYCGLWEILRAMREELTWIRRTCRHFFVQRILLEDGFKKKVFWKPAIRDTHARVVTHT